MSFNFLRNNQERIPNYFLEYFKNQYRILNFERKKNTAVVTLFDFKKKRIFKLKFKFFEELGWMTNYKYNTYQCWDPDGCEYIRDISGFYEEMNYRNRNMRW